MGQKRPRTDFLFARPSLLSGVARVFDLFGTFDRYNVSNSPEEADARAIASDWQMVGYDLNQTLATEQKRIRLAERAGAH